MKKDFRLSLVFGDLFRSPLIWGNYQMFLHAFPDPLKDPKDVSRQYEPMTTLGKLGDY